MDKKKCLLEIGRHLEEMFLGKYGHIQFNFQAGRLINVNVMESIKNEQVKIQQDKTNTPDE